MKTRPFIVLVVTIVLIVLSAPTSVAKAYYAPEKEMIAKSDAIAIVDISRVEKTEVKGKSWTYSEVANGSVVQTLKGTLAQQVQLHGGEDFICAQVHFQPGRFLVFLKRDENLLTGSNWHLSVRPIKDGKIEWFAPGERLSVSWQPLSEIIQRIEQSLGGKR